VQCYAFAFSFPGSGTAAENPDKRTAAQGTKEWTAQTFLIDY